MTEKFTCTFLPFLLAFSGAFFVNSPLSAATLTTASEGRDDKIEATRWVLRGNSFFQNGNCDEGMASYRSALEVNENIHEPHLSRTAYTIPSLDELLIKLSHYNNGMGYLEAITTGLVMRGNTCLCDDDTKKAMEFYKLALTRTESFYGSVDPKASQAVTDVGSLLIELASYDNGIEYARATTRGLVYRVTLYLDQGANELSKTSRSALQRITDRMFVSLRDRFTSMGKYEDAKVYAKRLVKMNFARYGTSNANTARDMEAFGELLQKLGKPKSAMRYLKAAQGVNKKKGSTSVSDIENWGWVHGKFNRNSAAEVYLRTVVDIKMKNQGKTHPDTLRTMGMYGIILRRMHEYKKAKIYLQMAVKVEKNKTSVRENLGMVLIQLYRYELDNQLLLSAKKYLKEVLNIRVQRYPNKNHPKLAEAMGNYGAVLSKLGKQTEAKPYLIKALQIDDRYFGSSHHRTARRIESLRMMAIYSNHNVRLSCLADALNINRKVYGTNAPRTAKTMAHIGNTLIKLGDYKKAKKPLEKALRIIESHWGKGHFQTVRVLEDLGRVHVKLKSYGIAACCLKEVFDIHEAKHKGDCPQAVRIMMNFWHALELGGHEEHDERLAQKRKLEIRLRKAYKKGINKNYAKAKRLQKNLRKVVTRLDKQKKAKRY